MALLASGLVVMGGAAPATALTRLSQTFTTTNAQTFVVPSYVTRLTVEAVGGRGGGVKNYITTVPGGRAARLTGTFAVTPGQTIHVRVGGNGGTALGDEIPAGGANGGRPGSHLYFGASGGGSDIRIGGTSLADRVLVAGGGAGTGSGEFGNAGARGSQTDAFWGCTLTPAQPGSQTAGGAGATVTNCDHSVVVPPGEPGTLGVGGLGGGEFRTPQAPWSGSSPGGGGYYGGGGGALGSGAGGSSYFSSAFTNRTQELAPSDSTPYVTFTWDSQVREILFDATTDVPADGTSRTPVTFALRDASGPINLSPTVSTTLGTVTGPATSLGQGRYRVELTAPQQPGEATVTVKAGGDSNSTTVTFTRRPQTIAVTNWPVTSLVGAVWHPQVSATSGLPVSVQLTGPCDGDVSAVTFTGAGTCGVTFNQAGNTLWAPDTTSQQVTVQRRAQSIAFPQPATVRVGEEVALSATSSAGLPVTFSASGAGCTVAGARLSVLRTTDCTVTAHQAGNTTYLPAPDAPVDYFGDKGVQAITFAPPADSALVGERMQLVATGGPSGTAVTFAVAPTSTPGTCRLDGHEVRFTGAGQCDLVADQAGNDDYLAAPSVGSTVTVSRVATTIELDAPAPVTHGEPVVLSARVADGVDGEVTFTLNGTVSGDPVPVVDGVASLSLPTLSAGTHQVVATFLPSDQVTYAPSTAAPGVLSVAKAATASTLRVHPGQVTASVNSLQPGTQAPTGTVHFLVDGQEVGTAGLVDGRATLEYVVPASAARRVAVDYRGDDNFLGSAGSTVRKDPTIAAHVSGKANAAGWRRQTVTVSFTCTPGSAPLAQECPTPVQLDRARGVTVTRTIHGADGGIATAAVSGLNVDRTAPTVRLRGVRSGGRYATRPKVTCQARDQGSGVARCRVRTKVRGSKLVYTATAVDRAGNRTRTVVRARLQQYSIELLGAPRSGGVAQVRTGLSDTYTLVVHAPTRPTYLAAAQSPRRPWVPGAAMHRAGRHRWALGVRFEPSMRHTRSWNIGVRVQGKVLALPVRVIS